MKRSTERFLTTHTGSLPRPDDLIRTMFAKEEGVPVDGAALAARIRAAVAEIVRKQAQAGVDIVNDGEMSKPSYATYVKDRLNGFGGDEPSAAVPDLVDFPGMAKRVFGDPGRARRKTPGLQRRRSRVRDARAAAARRRQPQGRARGAVPRQRWLHDRRVAGRDLALLPQRSLPEPRGLSLRDRRGDAARSTRRSPRPASSCRSTAPTSAMGRHIQYADLGLDDFRKMARLHVEALNHALANIPPEQMRMHLCWGNYEGPHHCDVPLADIIDIVFKARPAGDLVRGRQPAPRARVAGVRDA